ncbi:YafY family protein [Aliiglaciecola sp. CAU 1673]|uniref:helix-turn-helix transcriptional regulator n=1 Tax=Aliiglaciecola sp. CAU 1673 TaxID=3032595 RepID=UPI0023DC0AFE|nr:YafY family protein [Aliiglaciecola sp. CAU 1673]MDF2180062.1 YafY family protein [Aliiglaciecola sp. CAU 1673]
MRKAERLFQLLTLLHSHRGALTGEYLAERLGVSVRTIYRDMQALSLSNVPIQAEAGVGYRLLPGYHLPPLMFSEEELEALLLGVRMVRGWSDDSLAQAAHQALEKIQSALPHALFLRHEKNSGTMQVPDHHRQVASQFSEPLRDAIKKQQVIVIEYCREDGEHSRRTLWPLGLLYWGSAWTLVAWCLLRQDYRLFRLDRIQALQEGEGRFSLSEKLSLQHYIHLQQAHIRSQQHKAQ